MGEKKKVFISGPMSGIKDFNKLAFDKAEQWLTQAGFSVFNPARMHFDDTWTHEEIMRIDLAALAQCDYILMLDKWYYSKGALQEYHYANAIGVKQLSMSDIEGPKKESKPSQRIEIESFGNISGKNLEFLQWFEKYCNKILAKGGSLPGDIDDAIDDLVDYIRDELGIDTKDDSVEKACSTCKHNTSSDFDMLGYCLRCNSLNNWESKPTSDAPIKSCSTCAFKKCSLGEEPCKSCPPVHTNWKPKDAEK